MSKFGWSYPAGCNGPPDDDRDMHPLSEEVFTLLEDAGIEQETIDRICSGIDELAVDAEKECPACLDRYVKQQVSWAEGNEGKGE